MTELLTVTGPSTAPIAAIIAPADLPSLAATANAAHAKAHNAASQAVAYAMNAGTALNHAKRLVGHGGWLAWRSANCPDITERFAQIYMQLARRLPQLDPANAQRVAELSLREAIKAVSATNMLSVMGSSASCEWATPPHIFDLVVELLSEIDLDPCWHPGSSVRACTTYTAEEDGLTRPWSGKVFLNPPYGRTIDGWINKLIEEHVTGAITEAVALVPARVDTEWFRRLDCFPRCFVRGRLTFSNAETPAPFPNAVIYLGPNIMRFAQVFGRTGGIFVRLGDDISSVDIAEAA